MSGISGVGPAMGLQGVMALRAEILAKSQSLAAVVSTAQPTAMPDGVAAQASGKDFTATMADALKSVNAVQSESGAASAAWERGETQDIAAVMLSRQKASVAFEATIQTRNRLLSAYRDIMNMPV